MTSPVINYHFGIILSNPTLTNGASSLSSPEPNYLPTYLIGGCRQDEEKVASHCILMILIIRVMIVIAVTSSSPLRLPTSCGTPPFRHCVCPSINHWISTRIAIRSQYSLGSAIRASPRLGEFYSCHCIPPLCGFTRSIHATWVGVYWPSSVL